MGKKSTKSAPTGTFYHNYVCPSIDCLKAANPQPGSWHQRGLHLATDKPRTDVRCPGCGNAMVIGRDGDFSTFKEDKDGNLILKGNPVIYPAPGQPDQTAQIEAENGASQQEEEESEEEEGAQS